jgi:hypothetical protein
MAKKIRITRTTGPTDGANLDGYYFHEIDGTSGYNFYGPGGGNPINNQPLTLANPSVSFSIPQPPPNPNNNMLNYIVTVSAFPAVVQMSGSWSDTVSGSIDGAPGSGTFQAESSGTGPIEGEEAAAASGK